MELKIVRSHGGPKGHEECLEETRRPQCCALRTRFRCVLCAPLCSLCSLVHQSGITTKNLRKVWYSILFIFDRYNIVLEEKLHKCVLSEFLKIFCVIISQNNC